MQTFYVLENTIQTYVWGSFDGIPAFTGIVNTDDETMAELWMGAHPAAPSHIVTGKGKPAPLNTFIEENPDKILGKDILERFGARLPFLFKVLSVAFPLSLQVHPSKKQAEAGFARENLAGIPLLSPVRNYKDINWKPEIIMALSHFTALCGFRMPEETAKLISCSDSPLLKQAIEKLNAGGYGPFCHFLLELGQNDKKDIIKNIMNTVETVIQTDSENTEAYVMVRLLANRFPDDIGILAPLYLNIIVLDPGEALYCPSGIMHTYISGTGLELMASSDNTLRGGLTAKHIDIPELLSVLNPEPYLPAKLRLEAERGIVSYKTPSDDFKLSVVRLDNTSAEYMAESPSIIIGSTGNITASCSNSDSCRIARGSIIFVPANGKQIVFSGKGVCYIASTPVPGATC